MLWNLPTVTTEAHPLYSSCSATREATTMRSLLTATEENPHTETKTQCSQKLINYILKRDQTKTESESISKLYNKVVHSIMVSILILENCWPKPPAYMGSHNDNHLQELFCNKRSIEGIQCCSRHDWATSLSLFTFMHWRRKWQPTPVFLLGESQGRQSLVGCRIWGRTESDTTEATWQQQQQQ